MTDNENTGLPSLTAEEQAYFDNRGNVPQQEEKPEPVAKADQEPEDEDEEIDVVDDDPDAEDDEGSEEQPLKKVVPLKALHREREAKRALDEKLRAAEADRIRLEERLNLILRQMEAPQQKQDERQDTAGDQMPPDDDPIAQIEWLKNKVRQQEEQTVEQRKAQEQQQAIQRHVAEVDHVLTQAISEDPTIKEAFDFGVQALREHYARQGAAPWEVEQYVQRDMQGYALRAPKSKAQLTEYVKANARYFGWAPQPVAPKPTEVKPSTKSLSQASGSATGATISAQDVLRMAPDEFERWISKNPKKYRQMMGG